MGSQLASLCQEIETKFKFCELSTDARWGIRLSKLGVSILQVLWGFIHSDNYPVEKCKTKDSLSFPFGEVA